jgi:hypothetical protein
VIDSLSSPPVSSAVISTGSLQVSPPSVDLEARMAFRSSKTSKLSEIAYSVPSGPNETHGSEARS